MQKPGRFTSPEKSKKRHEPKTLVILNPFVDASRLG